ncbi:MAG: CvpA family protein [Candidatus Thiosymbion ectosymbiont of Robbea hypermnestra]|nr:CvpA family protein [Candidatus Thiosymbion ectosymbiont of Robbea hypermnestra]
MTWIDYAIIGIIVLSSLIGLMRGLLREVLSFIIWLAALFIAWTFYQGFAEELTRWTPHLSIRLAAAFLILFFAVLILGAMLGHLLYLLLEKKGFTLVDRVLGILFGAARGVILIAMLVFVGEQFIPLLGEKDEHNKLEIPEWWRESLLIDHFQALAEHTLAYIPQRTREGLKRL